MLRVGHARAPYRDETGDQYHSNGDWEGSGQVVDRAVRTLTAPTHLADVQQVRVHRVKDGLVETFCNIYGQCFYSKLKTRVN
jgi:hypothetical protein